MARKKASKSKSAKGDWSLPVAGVTPGVPPVVGFPPLLTTQLAVNLTREEAISLTSALVVHAGESTACATVLAKVTNALTGQEITQAQVLAGLEAQRRASAPLGT